jgi:hypothetical protein
VWPFVTCDNAVTAQVHGLKGFDVQPIVTCDNAIVMAQVCGLRGSKTWPIVCWRMSPDIIYMRPLRGVLKAGQEGKVLKPLKGLYGLKQAGRGWYLEMSGVHDQDRF